MNYKKLIPLILILFSYTTPAYADVYKIPELTQVITNITDTMSWAVGTILVLTVVLFGIQFIISADNPQERARLKTKLIWTIVGLFIVISAKPLSLWLQSLI